MLEELRRYNNFGNNRDIAHFFLEIIANRPIAKKDIQILTSDIPGKIIDSEALLILGLAFGIIQKSNESEKYILANKYQGFINKADLFVENMIDEIVMRLFSNDYLADYLFEFDTTKQRIRFKNEIFPLNKASYRNLLVSIGFIEIEKQDKIVYFFVAKKYEQIMEEQLKVYRKKMTLLQLKRKLEEKEIIGEIAENFVLEFETKRLEGFNADDCIRKISHIDVLAGYDILSYETKDSAEADRFIEVKAVNRDFQFYWSSNEINTSIAKGDRYYLYLVEVAKIKDVNYKPYIIKNPYKFLAENPNWVTQTQTLLIKRVF